MRAVVSAAHRFAEEHVYFDQAELLTQLGLMPELATAQRDDRSGAGNSPPRAHA